jgi:hypothetical protein
VERISSNPNYKGARNASILELHKAGCAHKYIAQLYGISAPRVAQIIYKELRHAAIVVSANAEQLQPTNQS